MNTTAASTASPHWLGLEGKVCVITGAAGGLGSEMARCFAAAGARVALLDLEEEGAQSLARDIVAGGGQAMGLRCDIAVPESVTAAAARTLRELGPCDVLVNNAGTFFAGPLIKVPVAQWDELMNVNARGYLLCAQAFGAQMMERRHGSIVHVSSIAGQVPQPYTGAFSVSKAAVQMMSRVLAVELGEFGIRSNVVQPAMVRTPATDAFYRDPDILRRRNEIAPLKRIGTPRDIAEAVLFLASDRASYITGEEVLVDGGLAHIALGQIPRPGLDRKDHA